MCQRFCLQKKAQGGVKYANPGEKLNHGMRRGKINKDNKDDILEAGKPFPARTTQKKKIIPNSSQRDVHAVEAEAVVEVVVEAAVVVMVDVGEATSSLYVVVIKTLVK